MSAIEQHREMTQQEKIDWDYSYTQGGGLDKWIPEYAIDYKKKCCDNCEYLYIDIDESVVCSKDVANDEYGAVIIKSNTFYCSYHKFRF